MPNKPPADGPEPPAVEVLLACDERDAGRVTALVEGLRHSGLEIWWQGDLEAGAPWRQALGERLETAGCVVVVWSEASVGAGGELIHDVATRAQERGVLVPVRIDKVDPPLGLRQTHLLDLMAWNGSRRSTRFKQVLAAVRGPRSRRPATLRTPDRSSRLRRWLATIGGIAGLTVAAGALLGTASDLVSLRRQLCQLPGVYGLCRWQGWGGVATAEEEERWRTRPVGDCDALRSYLAEFPDGAFAAEAGRRLQAAHGTTEEHWQPREDRLPLTVRAGLEPAADEETARAETLSQAVGEARRVCAAYEQIDGHRLLTAEPEPEAWSCHPRGDGVVCGFEGSALCRIETRRWIEREVCP